MNEIIERMKSAAAVSKNKDLADYLNISTQAITTWKGRNQVPYKECSQITERTTYSMDWLLFGKSSYDEGLMYVVLCDIGEHLKVSNYADDSLSESDKAQIIINAYEICRDLKQVTSKLIRALVDKDLQLFKANKSNQKDNLL